MISMAFRSTLAPLALVYVLAGTALSAPSADDANHTTPPPLPLSARFSERIYNLPGLANVGRVAPGIFRGAQPARNGYATLRAMGIKTVIDMRTGESERKFVEGAGMQAIAVPIQMTRTGLQEKVDRVVALMTDPANQPVYVHCRHGQDRTGIVVAAYRMKQQGWSLTDAETEMQAFGFNDIWINFKKFIRQYGSQIDK
ncbi:protein-tyrosine-phosphatase [Geobacter sp. FeAm09]|uniref:fused DSP-PTPase phosphatase/NAD kinase-like protein n=1 Tax=Geobacter sp. FeAm09 TaxID=2597769 RepID=UPI0011F049D4|nr:dual specificity protein phosphatase family protein [Geobacter sp. FeAm09]QEM68831.1 protein-tyrosine-phosphatase [Geobacter sp. FeAm09]